MGLKVDTIQNNSASVVGLTLDTYGNVTIGNNLTISGTGNNLLSGTVAIGTASPSTSAVLDVQSTTKGVRFPSMTTTQKNAVSGPVAGLVVYDSTLAKLCVYTGSAWQTITSA